MNPSKDHLLVFQKNYWKTQAVRGRDFQMGDDLSHRNVNFLKRQKATCSEKEHLIDRWESAQKLWEFDPGVFCEVFEL